MKIKLLMASVIPVFLCTNSVVWASEKYATFSFMLPTTKNEFGGQNSVGGFSNTDTQSSGTLGFQATYGLRDAFHVGTLPVSAEFDLALFKSEDITSASFPGLPSPTFFYTSDVKTLRFGTSFWSPVHEGNGYRTEIGLGLGAVYRDVSTTDGVAGGSGSDLTGYGQVGLRHVWEVSESGRMNIALNYVFTGKTSTALTNGGASAGSLTQSSKGVELSVGYQILLGK